MLEPECFLGGLRVHLEQIYKNVGRIVAPHQSSVLTQLLLQGCSLSCSSHFCSCFCGAPAGQGQVLLVLLCSWLLQVRGNLLAGEVLTGAKLPGLPQVPPRASPGLSVQPCLHSPVGLILGMDQLALCPSRGHSLFGASSG